MFGIIAIIAIGYTMNPSPLLQTIGNVCAGLATLIFLWPLQRFLWEWARREASNDQWVAPALYTLVPLWGLLMVGLLCVTASGGFDWMRLGRPALYALTIAAALALAVVSFVFIALYIRPGFTPRALYSPVLYFVTFSTVLLVVLSLNQKLLPGISTMWLLRPWTWFTLHLARASTLVCLDKSDQRGWIGWKWVV